MAVKQRNFVWVVMANDYPGCVFDTEVKADAYTDEKNEQERAIRKSDRMRRMIYWHTHKVPFNLRHPAT